MHTSSLRVLLVEDFELMRKLIRTVLEKRPGVQIIAEASNGLEAVRQAAHLKPDLILLDIGLPHLNGIEAARQIRELSPQSKILFVSQESSPDVVQHALNLGSGYVAKAKVATDLLTAVDAILLGGNFVSSR